MMREAIATMLVAADMTFQRYLQGRNELGQIIVARNG
jgi:hypothetical protein